MLDLYQSLEKRGIPLMLYWTGDGPRQDKQAAAGMGGWNGKVTDTYVKNWADVAAEYSRRYGDKVRGWWTDGCYAHIGYNEARWKILAHGLKAGNPHAIVALNNPAMTRANSSTDQEDFTTGEMNDFADIPDDRWRDGKQFHVLSYLGPGWGAPGCRYTLIQLADYVGQVTEAGGVVSIDVALFRDGTCDPAQIELLGRLRPAMQLAHDAPHNRAAVPASNLACWKPARLLTLDGTKSLPANGGGGQIRSARYGVDGDTNTWAQASTEWPWTFEVDLQQTQNVCRIAIEFGRSYATRYEVTVSSDRRAWQTVASKQDHEGNRAEHTFEPTFARYLRIRALKPDGPTQPGGQMQIVEIEAYAQHP